MKHEDYRPVKTKEWEDDWIIFPVDGYGNETILRQIMDNEKPDAIWFITDPRFYVWLFNMADEIRDRGIPLLYYHVWDNKPTPIFNKQFYSACDFIGCISKVTHEIVTELGFGNSSAYIPHAVDPDIFKPFSQEDTFKVRAQVLKENAGKFTIFYNSRNARRKMTADVLKAFRGLLDAVGEDKAFLFMHTDPHDQEGSNLIEVAKMLKIMPDQLIFSNQRIPPDQMAMLYNAADITMNISNNEGFGLSCLESLSCGTPVIVNKTGGLQDQAVDDKGNVFGCMLEPASRSIQGSQQIPYIYDDRPSDKELVESLIHMYNMPDKDRVELGNQARAWTLKRFSMVNLVGQWDTALQTYITKYKEKGNASRVKINKV